MKVLHSWLQRYISFRFTPEVLADRLGMLGLEVESIQRPGEQYDRFFVGRVLSVEKHPNADRLTVCRVALRGSTIQVVCGAPNVAAGQKVAVGTTGAVVPRNQHDPEGKPFVLGPTKIRGVESHGMICSAYELNLGDDADGIVVLDSGARTGVSLARYLKLDDVTYDLEVTPNRPDWLGHFGIAREIGVLTGRKAALPAVKIRARSAPPPVKVRVEDKVHCKRFAVRVIDGVGVTQSPEWLQQALKGVGLRPINTIVDVTNYVMMETGQPLHAFDLSTLKGRTIVVRQSGDEHPFETLDGKTVQLPAGTVMVCDSEREVSIAGIMGGANSEISSETTAVVLEAAWWDPSSIRKSARALGLSTDASFRFERGIDPDMIPYALDRAASLIMETSGGTATGKGIDLYPGRRRRPRVVLRTARVNQVLGTALRTSEIARLLTPLGLKKVGGNQLKLIYSIPGYRTDLEREIDLIEEVARVYGYDRIEEKTVASIAMGSTSAAGDSDSLIRNALAGRGFREILSIPLVERTQASWQGKSPVEILNPLSADMNSLRTSLVPGLLSAIARNIRNGNSHLRLFEIGHLFAKDTVSENNLVDGFEEGSYAALAMTGLASQTHWSFPDRMVDIFDLKGEMQSFLRAGKLDKCRFISYRTSDSLVDDTLAIETHGARVGYLGKVRHDLLKAFDIQQEVFVAEFATDRLRPRKLQGFEKFSRLPRVRRDVAFILDAEVKSEDVIDVLGSASSGLIKRVELFDLYEGQQLPAGKKSLAFSLELVPEERTLTDVEIELEVKRVVAEVLKRFDAQMRT
ncbi:MAG: phenylalanine--tRNA ligase subunit beta [Ignavibacteria bacterium]|nr:phenylalanine--tRNA ligase subunit beta [Ignavibacteria bacterium]